ncbi:MAG TPA: helicase-related protein [Vicinamibacterales bacterium]|nr:helicase-related protein [Vicinamibacterales bacterium]
MHGVLPLPGDEVWIRQRRWRVERAWRDRHVVRLDVASRDRRITFLTPFDQPLLRSGRRRLARVRRQQAAARAAALIAGAPDLRLPASATTARMDVLPYQLAPVLATIAGHTRLLLADDVGLGKTIQAGLIVAELVRREPAPRILLLVPAPLRDQWTDELRSRFSLTVVAADRATLTAMGRAGAFGENPWRRAGVWIASPDFLKQRHVFESLPPDAWDLLVIDEAHVACGDSERFETCQAVARRSRRVVLLTATPHSGDVARYARLQDIGRFGTPAAAQKTPDLLVFRRTRGDIGMPFTRRVRWHHVGLSDTEHRTLGALASYERAVLSSAGPHAHEHALLLLTVLRKRALSTFAALSRSISRRLGWLGETQDEDALDWVQPRLGFDDMQDDAAEEERAALTAHTGLDAGRERVFLRQLRGLADEAARRDSKVRRLVELINRTGEPIVVFSEFRDSLDAMERQLHSGRAISVLHGAQDPNERRLHLKRFLEGPASVLLATDVAGQGLNLQTRARWVASLELPWNPARLEQRIGRVDRIGQTRVPHLTLLVARHEAETGLLRHLAKRVLTARRSFAEDLLPSLLPGDAAVRATLLRSPLQPAPPPSATPACAPTLEERWPAVGNTSWRDWRRRADVVAREITHRRKLARCWRAPDETGGRSLWTPGNGVVLCSLPLLNDRDELVARLMVAATLKDCPQEVWRARGPLTQALRQALDLGITRVARKISRRWRAAGSSLARRERMVSAFILQSELPGEIQHGLFDHRAGRVAQTAMDQAEQTSLASARMIDRWTDGGSVHPGALVIEVAWIPRG